MSIEMITATSAAIAAIALVFSFLMCAGLQRNIKRQANVLLRMEQEMKVIEQGAVGMGQRILQLEKEHRKAAVNIADKPQVKLAVAAQQPLVDSGHSRAISLLQAGLDVAEVAHQCHMSQAEASLLKLINPQSAVA